MKKLDRYTSIFWFEDELDSAGLFYKSLTGRNWKASDFFIEEDKISWLKIDAKTRENIVRAFIISSAVKQTIGGVFLPLLNTSIGLDQITRRAMISKMESRLNGEHTQLNSSIILKLNPQTIIQKVIGEVRENKGLYKVLEQSEISFQAMSGWADVLNSGIEVEGQSSFDNLNYHVFQASALAVVMLETSNTLPMAITFSAMEGTKLPQILKGMRTMAKDTCIISSYIATIATNKLNLLPQERQVMALEWLKQLIEFNLKVTWDEELKNSLVPEEVKEVIDKLLIYNIGKAAVKLGLYPEEKVDPMPRLVERYLGVNSVFDHPVTPKNKINLKRRKK